MELLRKNAEAECSHKNYSKRGETESNRKCRPPHFLMERQGGVAGSHCYHLFMFKFSLNRLRSLYQKPFLADDAQAHYRVPPFTEELVKAVRLISTRLALKADEPSRRMFQMESNDAVMVEYEALQPLFAALPKINKVLEIGPGLGRSIVAFSKLGVWQQTATLHMYDANGQATKYKQEHYDRPPQWPDTSSFCGNIALLDNFLKFNGMSRYEIFDASTVPLTALPGPYDLIYGFFSVGYHWSIDYYLDEIMPLMSDSSVLVCTLNKQFEPFPRLANYFTRVLQSPRVIKNGRPLSFLALSKGPLPNVGVTVEQAFGVNV